MKTAIDLFCGCGGTTQGLQDAGFEVVGAVDISTSALKVFKANFENARAIQANLFDLTPSELLDRVGMKKGELDLLAGCPPCQAFSGMRTRNGSRNTTDERTKLVSVFVKFVIGIQPKAFAFENVPGLWGKSEIEDAISKLRLSGYSTDAGIVDAQKIGVPQRRRRLIALGSKHKQPKVVYDNGERKNVAEAISHLPIAGTSGDHAHDLPENRSARIRELISLIPKNGGSRKSLPDKFVLTCHRKYPHGFKDVYGRMSWEKPAPTITGGCASPSKGRFLHPEEDRCITIREAATLQGFPENFVFPRNLSKSELAVMIGNALPPRLIEVQARSLFETAHAE